MTSLNRGQSCPIVLNLALRRVLGSLDNWAFLVITQTLASKKIFCRLLSLRPWSVNWCMYCDGCDRRIPRRKLTYSIFGINFSRRLVSLRFLPWFRYGHLLRPGSQAQFLSDHFDTVSDTRISYRLDYYGFMDRYQFAHRSKVSIIYMIL